MALYSLVLRLWIGTRIQYTSIEFPSTLHLSGVRKLVIVIETSEPLLAGWYCVITWICFLIGSATCAHPAQSSGSPPPHYKALHNTSLLLCLLMGQESSRIVYILFSCYNNYYYRSLSREKICWIRAQTDSASGIVIIVLSVLGSVWLIILYNIM